MLWLPPPCGRGLRLVPPPALVLSAIHTTTQCPEQEKVLAGQRGCPSEGHLGGLYLGEHPPWSPKALAHTGSPVAIRAPSEHRFWKPSEVEEEVYGTHISEGLCTRRIPFAGSFTPVQHRCRAPRPDGRLCERQDRLKVRWDPVSHWGHPGDMPLCGHVPNPVAPATRALAGDASWDPRSCGVEQRAGTLNSHHPPCLCWAVSLPRQDHPQR